MRQLLFGLMLIDLHPGVCLAADIVEDRKQAAAAQAILQSWRESHAAPVERCLHVICWTPADREFPAEYRERLSRMLIHIQKFYASEMARNGFDEMTFGLQREGPDSIKSHEVRGKHPFEHYDKKSGSEIRDECRVALRQGGINVDEETIAIFCNMATWDEKELRFTHRSPYYAGGTYLQGTAWQLDSPELDTLNLTRTAPMIRDGEYGRISLGKHNSIFIGGMAHELGHAFALPHCTERSDERVLGTALMGAGNRTYGDELRGEGKGTFLSFAHALRLASHPLFCKHWNGREEKSTSSFKDLQITAQGKSIVVSGNVSGEPAVYGVVAYFDPEGHSDYDATTVTAVPSSDGRFTLRSDALPPGKAGSLRLIPLHSNGSMGDEQSLAKLRFSYRVNADGVPDLRMIQTRLELRPIVEALTSGDIAKANQIRSQIRSKAAMEIAGNLLQPAIRMENPADYTGDERTRPLTSFKAASAKVGWAKVTFNQIPDSSLLLESAGTIYTSGIYAHAPSHHEYSLGGKWQTLRGSVGLADGHAGSVQFTIKADGQQLWQSAIIRSDHVATFEVQVKGVNRLELLASTTDDGPSSDWGLWLEPTLRRDE